MSNQYDLEAFDVRNPPNNCSVIFPAAIAVELKEVGEDPFNVIQGMWPVSIACQF